MKVDINDVFGTSSKNENGRIGINFCDERDYVLLICISSRRICTSALKWLEAKMG